MIAGCTRGTTVLVALKPGRVSGCVSVGRPVIRLAPATIVQGHCDWAQGIDGSRGASSSAHIRAGDVHPDE